MQPSANIITYVALRKFALRAFNCLVYNRNISGPLLASYLFELPNHYSLLNNVKSINLAIFQKYFSKFVLHIYDKPRSNIDNFIQLWHQTSTFPTIFDHHYCWGSTLQKFCFFVYIYIISIYSQKLANSSDIESKSSHQNVKLMCNNISVNRIVWLRLSYWGHCLTVIALVI